MKGNSNNSIVKNSMMYTIANLLLKAFNFFLIPLYTAHLTTEEYGVINLASGFYTLVSSFIILSLQYAVIRFYADIHNDKKKISRMFGTVINFIVVAGISFLIVALIERRIITSYFFRGVSFFPIVFLSLLVSVVSGLYQVYQDILKGMQEARKSVWMSYFYFFLMFCLNVVAVVVLKLGAVGVITSTLIVNTILVLIMFVDLIKHGLYQACIDRTILKELLKYSLPLVPHTVAYNLQTYATKVIISAKLSMALLGIYSLASQFGSIADVILSSVQAAFQPWFYRVLNDNSEQRKKKISSLTYSLMWVYGLFFIGIGAFSQEAILLMANEGYAHSWVYVPLIVFSVALKSPLYFYVNFLYYDKSKTKYIFISTMLGCIVNIWLTAILVPIVQIVGSIIADIGGLIVRLAFTMLILGKQTQHIYSFWKLELYSVIPIGFLVLALIPSFTMFSNCISFLNLTYKAIIVLMYLGIACAANREIVRDVMMKRGKNEYY